MIAEGLRKELTEHSRAACPVCHTEFCAEQVHEFAPLSAETPVQADVDVAKQDYDVKEEKRRKQDQKTTALRLSIDSETESVLRDAAALFPECEGWDMLSGEGWLSGKIDEFQRIETDRKTPWRRAGKSRNATMNWLISGSRPRSESQSWIRLFPRVKRLLQHIDYWRENWIRLFPHCGTSWNTPIRRQRMSRSIAGRPGWMS